MESDLLGPVSGLAGAIERAEAEIGRYLPPPRLERHEGLSANTGSRVFLLRADLGPTGSFKEIPALTSVLEALRRGARGMVAASGGNFGKAVAYWWRRFETKGILHLPEGVDSELLGELESPWTEIRLAKDYDEAERRAIEEAREKGLAFLSPYNSEAAILGSAGGIGRKIPAAMAALGEGAPDVVLVSTGGGGLAAGVALGVKGVAPETAVVGSGIERSPALVRSLRAGRRVEVPCLPTLAGPLSGNLEPGRPLTLSVCLRYLAIDWSDEITEEEMVGAMRSLARHGLAVEPAGAVAYASLLKHPERYRRKKTVVVLCGRNIGALKYREIVGGA